MPISIHGKKYYTVAERVTEAHQKWGDKLEITTECILHNPVLFKATVKTPEGVFTGWSAANPSKSIEKQSPYEVAETSAIGRALGFSGCGEVEGIATADEMVKGGYDLSVASSDQIATVSRAVKKGLLTQEETKGMLTMTREQANELIKKASEAYNKSLSKDAEEVLGE